MRIEHINENSISLTIDRDELLARKLDVNNMPYGSENAKNLFNEMIGIASNELGFKPGTPFVVEAIPLPGGSIKLIITRVEDPDELDSRFSKFSPINPELFTKNFFEALESAFDKFGQELKAFQTKGVGDVNTSKTLELKKGEEVVVIFEFDSIDKASEACKNVTIYDYASILYKDDKLRKYFLVLSIKGNAGEDKLKDYNKVCNTLAEYGKRVQDMGMNIAYYSEHFDVIIKEEAVKKLAQI